MRVWVAFSVKNLRMELVHFTSKCAVWHNFIRRFFMESFEARINPRLLAEEERGISRD